MSTETEVRCPKCNSNQITANKKGFSGKKAVGGVLLTGGIGLLAGTLGSNNVVITCLACGKKFKPGEGKVIPITNDERNNLISEVNTLESFPTKKTIDMTPDELKVHIYQFHKWKADFYQAHDLNDISKMELLLSEVKSLRAKYDFKDILDLEILKDKIKDENYYKNIYESLKENEVIKGSGIVNFILIILLLAITFIFFKACG
jgi:DNA-directed RNA polymerase subunit RPC12/RpoP